MTTWLTFKNQLRTGLLEDAGKTVWDDVQLYYYYEWAVDGLLHHTAPMIEVEIVDGDAKPISGGNYDFSSDTRFEFTTTPYVDPGIHASVWVDDVLLSRQRFEWFGDELVLSDVPAGTVKVRYYGYYNIPTDENEDAHILEIPKWAELPVLYQCGSHALASQSVQSANIRQFNTKRDSGNPEHNVLEQTQKWFEVQYARFMGRIPPQERKSLNDG